VHPPPRRHSPRGRESAGGRIINPGAGQTLSLRSVAAGNQYSEVGQQRRGVLGTHFSHRAGRAKRSRRLRRCDARAENDPKWKGANPNLGPPHCTAIFTGELGIQAAVTWMLPVPLDVSGGTRKFT